jgi:hypothetical protein
MTAIVWRTANQVFWFFAGIFTNHLFSSINYCLSRRTAIPQGVVYIFWGSRRLLSAQGLLQASLALDEEFKTFKLLNISGVALASARIHTHRNRRLFDIPKLT